MAGASRPDVRTSGLARGSAPSKPARSAFVSRSKTTQSPRSGSGSGVRSPRNEGERIEIRASRNRSSGSELEALVGDSTGLHQQFDRRVRSGRCCRRFVCDSEALTAASPDLRRSAWTRLMVGVPCGRSRTEAGPDPQPRPTGGRPGCGWPLSLLAYRVRRLFDEGRSGRADMRAGGAGQLLAAVAQSEPFASQHGPTPARRHDGDGDQVLLVGAARRAVRIDPASTLRAE